VIVGFAIASLLSTGSAVAQSSVTVAPSSATVGGTVAISGRVPVSGTASCPADDAAQLTSTADLFPPDGFGPQVSRDASGAFHVSYTVPATTPVGTYTIGVRCGGGNTGVAATLDITAARPSTTLAQTTTTASPPAHEKTTTKAWWIALLVVVLVLGLVAVVVLRRRR